MPVQESMCKQGFSHVNLMTDTLIANLSDSELRAIVRALLAYSEPSVAERLTIVARERLKRSGSSIVPAPSTLFVRTEGVEGSWIPTDKLQAVMVRVRTMYGAGMGLAALRILTAVVTGAACARWEANSRLEDFLPAVDADIISACTSAKSEIQGGRVSEDHDPEEIRRSLLNELDACRVEVQKWDGEFPFKRAYSEIVGWRMGPKIAGRCDANAPDTL